MHLFKHSFWVCRRDFYRCRIGITITHCQKFEGRTEFVWGIAYLPGSQWVITCESDDSQRIWEQGADRKGLAGYKSAACAAVLSSDGKKLVSKVERVEGTPSWHHCNSVEEGVKQAREHSMVTSLVPWLCYKLTLLQEYLPDLWSTA
jgi:hypothetical protein